MKRILLLAIYFMSACAHSNAPEGAESEVATATGAASNTLREGFGHAVLTPARDLNLMRDPIPPALLSISQVYQIEGPVSCEALNQELATLDDALGPDTSIGEDEETDDPESTGSSAGEFALDALSDTTGNLIPFRGLIRRAIRRGFGDSVSEAGQRIVDRNLNIQPTIKVRPGAPLRVIVTRDLILRPH